MNSIDRLRTLAQLAVPETGANSQELGRELVKPLTHIVRRILREGDNCSALGKVVWAEARRVVAPSILKEHSGLEALAPTVARRLCEQMVARLRPHEESRRDVYETLLC